MTSTPFPAGATRETGRLELADDQGSVTVRKIVSKGERLAIETESDGVKLDALLLESLAWQRDRDALSALLGDPSLEDPLPLDGTEPVEDADDISISNEYSRVVVSKVISGTNEGIRIRAPARGTGLALGVPTLIALAGLDDTFAFSEWFKTPFGPEDAPLEGPL